MIKKLRLKFVLIFLVLVVSIFITSSCYALSSFTKVNMSNCSISMDNIKQIIIDNGYESYLDKKIVIYGDGVSTEDITVFVLDNSNIVYLKEHSTTADCINFKDLNDSSIQSSYLAIHFSGSTFTRIAESNNVWNFRFSSIKTIYRCDFDLYDSSGTLVYTADVQQSVNVTHEFKSDTSAKVNFDYSSYGTDCILKYSLSGVEISIDLNAPLQLKNPVTYSPGVTNLILKPKTKVYWALYDINGDCLESDVYQVPEYDVVVENADKDIEYTVTYNEDNTLATLTVNVINGEFSDKLYYTENGMISNDFAGKILFPASRSLEIDHNCNMHIILYDYFGNLITAEYVTINEIGLIPEYNFKIDVTTGDKTVYIRPRLYNVLQSRFYSIEYDVILDTFTSSKDIDLFQDGVYVGNVTDTSKTYTCGSDSELKFYQSIGTSNITVTFRIINAETGVTCITRTVSFKIGLNDESTGVTDSTTNGNSDNSFITSNGASVNNSGGYSNVSWGQISSMINTNSDFWQIIKNILNCLPIWITAPIFFFISAIVTICLTKIVLSIVGHLVG